MPGLETPDSILTLLDAIRTQIDVVTTLSSGGLGVIILTWGRILGILDDADFSKFQRPGLLLVPALLLLCAVVLGYLAGAQTTGFFTEIAQGVSSKGVEISDPRVHYFADYRTPFDSMMGAQLLSSVLGILTLSGWFAWNVSLISRRQK